MSDETGTPIDGGKTEEKPTGQASSEAAKPSESASAPVATPAEAVDEAKAQQPVEAPPETAAPAEPKSEPPGAETAPAAAQAEPSTTPGDAPAAEAGPADVAPAKAAPGNQKIGLILLDIGAPADARDVKPFLRRLYGDARMMRVPFGVELQKLFAAFLVMARAPSCSSALAAVGGSAPERPQLDKLVPALDAKLNDGSEPRHFSIFLGLRHASPSIAEAVAKAREAGCQRIVGLWSRPFGSQASISARSELALLGEDQGLDVSFVDHYDDAPEARAVWGQMARQALEALPEDQREGAHLLFALQGMPIPEKIDPALEAANAFARAVVEAEGLSQLWSVAYQCGTDPRATLIPAVEDELTRLGAAGKPVAVVPLAHACETLATRWELDMELRKLAEERGVKHFARAAAPAERPDLVEALAAIVRRHVGQMEELRAAAA